MSMSTVAKNGVGATRILGLSLSDPRPFIDLARFRVRRTQDRPARRLGAMRGPDVTPVSRVSAATGRSLGWSESRASRSTGAFVRACWTRGDAEVDRRASFGMPHFGRRGQVTRRACRGRTRVLTEARLSRSTIHVEFFTLLWHAQARRSRPPAGGALERMLLREVQGPRRLQVGLPASSSSLEQRRQVRSR